jgi:hypothetical protein
VFANGDVTGLQFHGDFLNGWDQDVLAAAVSQCTSDLYGDVEGLSFLSFSLGSLLTCQQLALRSRRL